MRLLEYQAHKLFLKFDLPGARGVVVSSPAEIETLAGQVSYPVVLKAQVQTGGRGKAGGIAIANSPRELVTKGKEIFRLTIKGHAVRKIFLTDVVELDRELYLSITLDRRSRSPVIIFSSDGGVEINSTAEVDPTRIIKTLVDPFLGINPYMIQYILDITGLDANYSAELERIVERLYSLFQECDCLLAEINPLAIDVKGQLVALDAKVEIDDNALMRHPDFKKLQDELTDNNLVRRARAWDFLYIPVTAGGNVGVISNGSGMIMSCIDLLTRQGLMVACALDLGGGATSERVKEAIQILFENKSVSLVFINVFGGITRCDEIALGVKLALESNPDRTIILRMEGTNKDKGIQIVNGIARGVEIVADPIEGVGKVYEKVVL